MSKLHGIQLDQAAPEAGETGLQAYRRAIRSHLALVFLIVAVTVGASVAYLVVRSHEYKATATVLVTPLPADDPTFLGLPFVHDSGDPTRTVETAASLVDTPDAANLLAKRLDHGWTRRKVQKAVDVVPQGQSNIIDVTGSASTPAMAVRLADGFVSAAFDARRTQVRRAVATALLSARSQLASQPPTSALAQTLAARVSALQSVQNGNDPTLSVSQLATSPTSPSGTSNTLVVLLAIVAGLVLGIGAALLLDLLTPRRIESEAELLGIRQRPVLARVPNLPRSWRRMRAKGPAPLPPGVREALVTLQLQLELQEGRHQVVLFTSGSSGDGKTMSVVNFAYELAAAGREVIALDLDLRKPDLGRQLGVEARRGIELLIAEGTKLEDILVQSPQAPAVRVAPALGSTDPEVLEVLAERLPDAIREALLLADYVLIDTAPLGEISDALRFVPIADDVIVVGRLGNTNRAAFEVMLELLDRVRVTPAGYLLIGATAKAPRYYGYGGPREAPTTNGAPPARRPAGDQR